MKECLVVVGKLQECSVGAEQVTLHVNETEFSSLVWVVLCDETTHVFLNCLGQWGQFEIE